MLHATMTFAGLLAAAAAAISSLPAAAQGEPLKGAAVVVVKATTACFSDTIRVAGYLVPRRMAVVNVESDAYSVTEINVSEGDTVISGQTLAKLTRQAADAAPAGIGGSGGAAAAARPPSTVNLRAPAAGVVIKITARLRESASPQAEPLFQILVDNELELEADIPSIHVGKLRSGEPARISVAGGRERQGRVRLVAPSVGQRTQLGKVRLSIGVDPAFRLGMFATAAIDASRSCGVAIPRGAVEYSTRGTSVQVLRAGKVETRRVVVGLRTDEIVEIREGVSEGDVVVADAGTSLHDGDPARPIFAGDTEQARAR